MLEKLPQPEAHHHEASKASALLLSIHDSLSEEPRVGPNVSASERGPSSTEVHQRDQGHGASQSLHIHNSVLKQQLKESLPSNAHAFNGDIDNRVDITRTLAHLAVQRLKSNKLHFVYFEDPGEPIEYRSTYLVPLISDIRKTPGCDLSATDLRARNKQSRFHFVYGILPSGPDFLWLYGLFISYGAFHLIAWNAHFPTTIERWMWRASGLIIVGNPALISGFFLLEMIDGSPSTDISSLSAVNVRWWQHIINVPKFVLKLFMMSLVIPCAVFILIAIPASRLYFGVEAFISLRDPGPRTYETVEWTQFWPHG